MHRESRFLIGLFVLITSAQLIRADSYSYKTFSVSAGATRATGINNLGQVTGFTELSAGSYGFVYDNGVATTFAVPQAGAPSTQSISINNLEVVGGATVSGGVQHGFLYDHGAFSTVAYPSSNGTAVTGINDLGQIVGTYVDGASNAKLGFFTDASGNYQGFSGPIGATFLPNSINNSGEIGGIYNDGSSGPLSAVFKNGSFTVIYGVHATHISLRALNDVGQELAYSSSLVFSMANGFFVSNPNGLSTRLDFPSTFLSADVAGLNDLGQVSGFADTAAGRVGFVATPTPEPGSFVLAAVGLAAGSMLIKRKRQTRQDSLPCQRSPRSQVRPKMGSPHQTSKTVR